MGWDLIIRYAKKTFIPQVPDRKVLLSTHPRSSQKLLLSNNWKFRLIIFKKIEIFYHINNLHIKYFHMIFQQKKWNIVVCDICHTFDHTYCKGCQPNFVNIL